MSAKSLVLSVPYLHSSASLSGTLPDRPRLSLAQVDRTRLGSQRDGSLRRTAYVAMGIGPRKLVVFHDHSWEVGVDRSRIGGGVNMEDAGVRNGDIDRAGIAGEDQLSAYAADINRA